MPQGSEHKNVRAAKFHIVQIHKKGCLQEIGKHPPIAKHNKIIDIIFFVLNVVTCELHRIGQ